MAKNVKLEEALDIVESKLVVKEVLKDLIKEAVEKQNRPKLKPITLKLNNLTTQKPTLINNIIKKPKSNFKVIRVSPSLKKVTKRPGSGLDVSDYKGKKRKNRRPKKLDKLIIRNMASLNKEPTSEEICSSVLNGIIQNLPCFSKDNKNNTPAPVMLKIRKTQIPNAQMKNLFNNTTTKNPNENNKIVCSNSKSSSVEDAKIKRQKLLKKQLGIDMVNQGGIDNRMIIGAVNNTNKRKAKLEARKALVVPTKRRKNNSDEEKKNDNSKLDAGTDIDEEVVENIFDQIMGDADEESSTSSIDELKPAVPTKIPPPTKVSERKS